jgi:hypothetical protein
MRATTCYVEPTVDNFQTYSIGFARILLSTGGEIDIVAEVMFRQLDSQQELDSMEGRER